MFARIIDWAVQTMLKVTRLVTTALLVSLVLTACEAPGTQPIMRACQCSKLPNILPLRAYIGTRITAQDFQTWISTTYQVPIDSIILNEHDANTADYQWENDGINYRAAKEQSILTTGWASYDEGRVPSAECIVSCFGVPEWYRAYFTRDIPGHSLEFEMLFPEHGILVSGVEFFDLSQEQPPPITEEFPMDFLRMDAAGTRERLLGLIYGDGTNYEKMLVEFKPWTGDWQDIKIDIDPTLSTSK